MRATEKARAATALASRPRAHPAPLPCTSTPRPSAALAQVRSVETVIQLCFRLKQAVGSHALMVGSGFEHLDSMQAA